MTPISPVLPGIEAPEIKLAESQPEYQTLPAVRGKHPEHRITARMKLTDDDRKRIAEGADIMLTVLTFGHPLQPFFPWVASWNTPLTPEDEDFIRELTGLR